MADLQDKTLPEFQPFATAEGFLTDAEMDRLIADHAPLLAEAKLGAGGADSRVRRSQVVFFGTESRYQWLYERVWAVAQECNRRFFCVDIAGVEANIQLARYDSSDQGFYDWHTDFAGYRPLRKLSVSIQLSRPDDYEGGDLELQHLPSPTEARQEPAAASSYSRASCCIALRPSRAARAGASSPGSWAIAGADGADQRGIASSGPHLPRLARLRSGVRELEQSARVFEGRRHLARCAHGSTVRIRDDVDPPTIRRNGEIAVAILCFEIGEGRSRGRAQGQAVDDAAGHAGDENRWAPTGDRRRRIDLEAR